MRSGIAACLLLIALSIPAWSHAQAVLPAAEYQKKIKAATDVGALGADAFGNSTSDSTGKTVFTNVDIDLPGNNALPVRFGRRLPIEPRYIQEELGGLGNWDIDVPYIEATFSKTYGWSVAQSNSPNRYKRCSLAAPPMVEGMIFSSEEVFHGYRMHIPGVLDDLMMKHANNHPNPITGTYPWVVGDTGRVSCLSTIKNGQPGEGFIVHLEDGTRYYFDYLVERTAPTLRKGPKYVAGYSMPRKRLFMLATRIEDRFGNFVNLQYSGNHLTSVTGSDGRLITIQPNATGYVATANGRQWQYRIVSGQLVDVTNPDGSKWTYSPFGTYTARIDNPGDALALSYFSPGDMCLTPPSYEDYAGTASFDVTHPGGAQGAFTFSGNVFSRSRVPYLCVIDFFDHDVPLFNWAVNQRLENMAFRAAVQDYADCVNNAGPNGCSQSLSDFMQFENEFVPDEQYETIAGHARIMFPNTFPAMSLSQVVASGPGIAPTTTQYAYQNEVYQYCDLYDHQTGQPVGPTCMEDACAGGDCTDGNGRWTTVTLPNGDKIRKRHGVVYGVNEGLLLEEQRVSAQGAVMRHVLHSYLDGASTTTQTFNRRVGWAFTPDPVEGLELPLISTEIRESGESFFREVSTCGAATVYCFDVFARPTKILKTNSLGYLNQKYEVSDYHDNFGLWVLGQGRRQYTLNSAPNGEMTSGAMVSLEVEYNAQALPWKTYAFGKLQQTMTYHPDGTVASVTDGRGNATTLTNWKRGIPQHIQFPVTPEAPTGAIQSAAIDDNGRITSTTDENSYATGYSYDPMGRLTGIAYPTGDTTVWSPKGFEFRPLTSGDWLPSGITAGQWRHYEGQGNYAKFTYFDAMWRPVLVLEYDTSNVGPTVRYTRTAYDSNGRMSFQSYPVADPANTTTGIRTFYDALDRVTSVQQDSEHGVLTTKTEYLAGLQVRVTNPRNLPTTTGFMAWDQPGYELPLWSSQPEGKVIEISRHPQFGWPLQLKQRSADNSLQASRQYVYDGNAQLCKTIEPETGASVMGYDAAGNLAWQVAGLSATSFNSTTNCQHVAAAGTGLAVGHTYDARNRLTHLTFPDGKGNQIWTYEKDNLPASVTAYNDSGNATPVVTAYTYNKRRLLTGETLSQPNWYTWSAGYQYNPNGHLSNQVYPTGLNIDFAPNALGQPTKAGAYASGAQYYPNGSLKQFSYGNGVVHSMQQNSRQLPSRVTSSGGVSDFTYNYDANANITNIWDLARGDNYSRWMTYDNLDRLTSAGSGSFGGDAWHRFAYDALDNIKSWKLAGVKDYADYIYDSQNRLTSIRNTAGATVVGIGYDAQGNLQNKNGQAYEFDYGNRLRGVINKEYYRYDGLGRRVLAWEPTSNSILSQYTQSGKVVYQENHRTSVASEHVYLGGSLIATRDRNWVSNTYQTKYQHTDALGSPVAVTNEAGAVIERNNYEPYGAIIGNPTRNGIGYTGHVMDGVTGLTYMQQRYYDQSIGRFLSVDPVAAEPKVGANFNRYWYANNNPYRFTDPDGRQSVQEMIDSGGSTCGAFSCAGWAALSATWQVFGAEGVSQIADKGMGSSNGDKASAVLEVATAGKGKWLAKLGEWGSAGVRSLLKGGCSFDDETLVQTDRGLVAIASIKVGDKVLAKNEATGVESYQAVVATFSEWHESTLTLSISSGKADEAIITTDEHPFYVNGKGFVPAALLKIGDVVRLAGDKAATVVGIKRNKAGQLAYNLTVANDHTYFVGNEKVWVHNSCIAAIFTQKNIQKGFTKHGADFGIAGNWNPSRGQEFVEAVNKHINGADVSVITGSYRGNVGFTHYFNPKTSVNVVLDGQGNYVTGYKLSPAQVNDLTAKQHLF